MDELEEDADDYDEYDMDQGSEGDMDGELFASEPLLYPGIKLTLGRR